MPERLDDAKVAKLIAIFAPLPEQKASWVYDLALDLRDCRADLRDARAMLEETLECAEHVANGVDMMFEHKVYQVLPGGTKQRVLALLANDELKLQLAKARAALRRGMTP